MGLAIDKVHERIGFLIKKSEWGYASHDQIDIAIDIGQLELFEEYYGNPNKYQAGRPIPPVAYGQTQKVSDSLKPFIVDETIDSTFAPSGLIAYPTDYRDYLGAYITYTDSVYPRTKGLEMVSQAQRAFSLDSQLMPVRSSSGLSNFNSILSNAFITMEESGFQIYPKGTYAGTFSYLRLPTIPVFAYTISGRTVTYDSGSSVQLDWSNDDIDKIIMKAVGILAIGLQDQPLFNEARIKDKD